MKLLRENLGIPAATRLRFGERKCRRRLHACASLLRRLIINETEYTMASRTCPEKAHRLPREAYRGELAASITICFDRRGSLFTDPAVVSEFAQVLRAAAERRSCLVLVYCFMSVSAGVNQGVGKRRHESGRG